MYGSPWDYSKSSPVKDCWKEFRWIDALKFGIDSINENKILTKGL